MENPGRGGGHPPTPKSAKCAKVRGPYFKRNLQSDASYSPSDASDAGHEIDAEPADPGATASAEPGGLPTPYIRCRASTSPFSSARAYFRPSKAGNVFATTNMRS